MDDDPREAGRAAPLIKEFEADELDGLRPSALLTYALLRCSGPLTRADLATAMSCHRHTVSDALSELRDRDLLAEAPAPSGSSARKQYWVDTSGLFAALSWS